MRALPAEDGSGRASFPGVNDGTQPDAQDASVRACLSLPMNAPSAHAALPIPCVPFSVRSNRVPLGWREVQFREPVVDIDFSVEPGVGWLAHSFISWLRPTTWTEPHWMR